MTWDDFEHGEDFGIQVGSAEAIKETEKALLCVIDDNGKPQEEWIPKSQIHDDSEVYEVGHSGKLIVTTWFAEQKGWD